MGGDRVALSEAEAASALRWWLESGVDALVQEEPRNWLEQRQPAAKAQPEPAKDPTPAALPDNLLAFREWLTTSSEAPFASARSKPIVPHGDEQAEVMLLAEMPGREDASAGQPIGGEAWELTGRMLAAIGLDASTAYVANLACFYAPGAKLSSKELDACAVAARQHVVLAKPKRLLLLGDAPARALLGKLVLEARGHVHNVEGVRTVATFHPRFLINRPSDKGLAWRDLLLLMEDQS